jgi:methyl-accepting chemotaxis protein
MNHLFDKEIRSLNWKLELSTYLVNVPIGAIFVIFYNKIYDSRLIPLLISIGLAVILTLIFSVSLRIKILKEFIYAKPSIKNKLNLLKIPIYCAGLVQAQWIIGILTVMIAYGLYIRPEIDFYFSTSYMFLFMAPINFITHASVSDVFTGKVLNSDIWRKFPMEKSNISSFPIFARIVFNNISLLVLTLGSLALLFYHGNLSDTSDPYKIPLLSAILFQSCFVGVNSAFNLGNSTMKNINNIKYALSEFKEGNIGVEITPMDNEEIGLMMIDFQEVQVRISDVIKNVNSTIHKLNTLSKELASNSGSISNEAQNLSALSEELSSSLTDFSTSIESSEISAKAQENLAEKSFESLIELDKEIQKNSEKAEQSKKLSIEATHFSEQGAVLGGHAEQAIIEIKEESHSISEYTKIIADIAERVSLLSLNASIEAARAGEYGRGFAVVAKEISKLGENTSENSTLISKKIIELRKKVSLGVEKIQSLSESFSFLQTASKNAENSLIEMNQNLQNQTTIKEKVILNLQDLKKSAQTIRDSNSKQKSTVDICVNGVREVSTGSGALAESTVNLEKISAELKLDADKLTEQMKFFR